MIINSQITGSSSVGGLQVTVDFTDLRAGLVSGQICAGYLDVFGAEVTFPLTCTVAELHALTPVITTDTSVLTSKRYLEINGVDLSPSGTTGKCANNTALEEAVIYNITSTSVAYLFQNDTSLRSVVIGDGCTFTNTQNTFYGCNSLVEAPTFPSTVTNMNSTFYGCQSMVLGPAIPSNVTNVKQTFKYCISLVKAPALPSKITVMNSTFYGCMSMAEAPEIPSTVTDMSSAFYKCSAIKTAPTLPSKLKTMSNTFYGCTSLTTMPSIPSTVTNMTNTFAYCRSMNGYNAVPSGVTTVNGVFSECSGLSIVSFCQTTPPTYNDALAYMTSLTKVYVPSSTLATWKAASGWSDFANLMVGA